MLITPTESCAVLLKLFVRKSLIQLLTGMMEQFGVDERTVKIGQMLFLVMYAFGCEAWAPWSEELGRKWVMQGE